MKILISGGCGFIGTNIALEAKSRGHEVVCYDNLSRKGSNNNMDFLVKQGVICIVGDILNIQGDNQYDGIIHLAANAGVPWSIDNPVGDFEQNAVGTLNLLEYARERKTPFIFASTNKVYPNRPMLAPVNEDFPIDAGSEYHHSPYGVSKLAADQYCLEYYQTYGVPTVVNRMSCIYGLYQNGVSEQGWIDHFIRTIGFGDGKIDIFGNGLQVRDMLWGGDVAKLYLDQLENIDKVKGQVFNVGGGDENKVNLLEAIELIELYSGNKADITFKDWRQADQKYYVSDISKVTSMLNWKPTVSPREGIRMMYENYRINQP